MSSYSKASAAGVVTVVTIIEDAGLVVWFALVRSGFTYIGVPIPAIILLAVLLVEHSIMQRAENPNFTGSVFGKIFGFSLLEVVNWSVWVTLLSNTSSLLSISSLIASAYFFVGFYVEHQITENVITGQPFLHFRNSTGRITAGVIAETLSEGVGARLWVFFALGGMGPLAIGFLIVGSAIEHSIQYIVGRIAVTRPVMGSMTSV